LYQRIYILDAYYRKKNETYSDNPETIVDIDAAGSDFNALGDMA
jgi:hypothetical protein